jgi:hypothetical protein
MMRTRGRGGIDDATMWLTQQGFGGMPKREKSVDPAKLFRKRAAHFHLMCSMEPTLSDSHGMLVHADVQTLALILGFPDENMREAVAVYYGVKQCSHGHSTYGATHSP